MPEVSIQEETAVPEIANTLTVSAWTLAAQPAANKMTRMILAKS